MTPGNVADAIERNGIAYPVVQDNEFGTWTAFGNQYWPAKYLIDAEGEVRYVHFGEGDYEETEEAIRSLLAEAGDERPRPRRRAAGRRGRRPGLRTPETYLGTERAQGWVEPPQEGERDYEAPEAGSLAPNAFAYGGRWSIDAESATAVADATRRASGSRRGACSSSSARDGGVPRELCGRARRRADRRR